MLIIGLTGSIGMGKSTAAARFIANGIAVFDADAEVHRLYAGPLGPAIEAAFPGTAEQGEVDRARLSAALLKEPHRMPELEAIVHPAVRASERAFLDSEFARGARLCVLEIPLLFETGADANVDLIVVVSAPPHVQRARVLMRPGMTAAKLDQLLARQTPDAEKRARADFVVETGGTVAACHAQIDAILAQLASREGRAYARVWQNAGQ